MQALKIDLNPKQTVLVLGGFGFIGKHVTQRLELLGANVIIGTRGVRGRRLPGSRIICLHKIKNLDEWHELLQGVDVVINAVGILRQRHRESYQQVHNRSIGLLAQACEKRDIRMVHVSALGLCNPVRSRFLSSKLDGEKAIQETNADWHIIRPSLIDGDGGYGTKWFQRVANWPIHFAPANAQGQLRPVNVNDVAEAICNVALSTQSPQSNVERIYELGGNHRMDLFEYLATLTPNPPTIKVRIPSWVARISSHLFDLLHLTPFSFGHYELLKFDNCPASNDLPRLLGRAALPVGQLKPQSRKFASDQTVTQQL